MLVRFLSTEFIPEADEGRISVSAELTTGLRVEETIKVSRQLEQIILENYPEVEILSVSSGSDDEGGMMMFADTGPNIINMMMRLSELDKRERSVWEIARDIREHLSHIPDIVEYSVEPEVEGPVRIRWMLRYMVTIQHYKFSCQ